MSNESQCQCGCVQPARQSVSEQVLGETCLCSPACNCGEACNCTADARCSEACECA